MLDNLLEKADTSLDEFSGAVKRLSPGHEQVLDASHDIKLHILTRSQQPSSPRPGRVVKSQEIAKPQLSFDHVPTNTEAPPFKPLLSNKPHARKALGKSLDVQQGKDGLPYTTHPYLTEIREYEYPSFVYTNAEPIPYEPFESTTATYVDTEEALDEMLEELKQAREIAIDLEHHDHRSYIGLVSLMQISTRKKDWIVDTLKPWRRKLSELNEVFADPNILKVLHGAQMDIIWLQRDLGLYIVGLFDTHHACRVLGYPAGSLAFLLKKFIDFDAQKQYQMADWRTRPLSQELFDYARSDTHFLLYIYDNMRNELIDRSSSEGPEGPVDKLHEVLTRSKETALQVYNHPVYDAERGLGAGGWYRLLTRSPTNYTKEQFAVFRALHRWRDQVAREQDDSVHYVLSNHHLFNLAREMPTEKAALFNLVQPTPQSLRLRVDEVIDVITRAKASAEDDTREMREVLNSIYAFLHPEEDEEMTEAPTTTTDVQPLPQAAPAETVSRKIPEVSLSALRAPVSSFWGANLTTNRPRLPAGPRLHVPLPPLTAEVFTTTNTPTTPAPAASKTPASATPASAASTVDNDIFTLRSAGKRHREEDIDALATQNDEVALGSDNRASRRAEKAAKKAEKQAAKRAKLEEKNEGEAFDYTGAESVLKAADGAGRKGRKGKDEGEGKSKGKEIFSLAKGLGDVARGLGRRQKDQGGRSMTFK